MTRELGKNLESVYAGREEGEREGGRRKRVAIAEEGGTSKLKFTMYIRSTLTISIQVDMPQICSILPTPR
jgi:hypothetical protein